VVERGLRRLRVAGGERQKTGGEEKAAGHGRQGRGNTVPTPARSDGAIRSAPARYCCDDGGTTPFIRM
jgi:hypothetical protein